MKKKFNFVYLTTNIVNGKQYVGDHCTNNLEDGYIGSGKIIINAVKKHGKKNFKREILESFNTKEDAFNAQEKYINKYNTLIPNGYNLSPTGGLCVIGCLIHTLETKEKMSKSQKLAYTKERRNNVIENNKKRVISQEQRNKQSFAMKGKTHSEETKEKISKSNKGRIGPMLGKHHTKETKEKISNNSASKREEVKEKIKIANTGKIRSKQSRENYSKAKKGIVLSEEHKKKISECRKQRELSKGKNNPMYGRSVFSIWKEKYGEEIASKKLLEMKEKMKTTHNRSDLCREEK